MSVEGGTIQIIVLDTRIFALRFCARTTAAPMVEIFPWKTMLGEAQWAWLDAVLGSGRPSIGFVHPAAFTHGYERWGAFH